MSKKTRKTKKESVVLGQPITLPLRYATLIVNIQKLRTSLGIADDYANSVSEELKKLGIEELRRQELQKKFLEAEKAKKKPVLPKKKV